jgi:hypothetical protein
MLAHMRLPREVSSRAALSLLTAALFATGAGEPRAVAEQAQTLPPNARSPYAGPTPTPAPVEKLGPDLLQIASIRVDLAKRELTVPGVVNDVQFLEFLANTKGGFKAYESALELDTNAVNFNVACLLIGLDHTRAVRATRQFDPQPPQGDPVEIFVEWEAGGTRRRVRAEQLIYSKVSKTVLTEGPWVYTGSSFVAQTTRYLAEIEGTLVGFMHTPAPIIESPRPLNGAWGDSIINPELELKAGTPIHLLVRALPRAAGQPSR